MNALIFLVLLGLASAKWLPDGAQNATGKHCGTCSPFLGNRSPRNNTLNRQKFKRNETDQQKFIFRNQIQLCSLQNCTIDEDCSSVQPNTKCCQTSCGLKCLTPFYGKQKSTGTSGGICPPIPGNRSFANSTYNKERSKRNQTDKLKFIFRNQNKICLLPNCTNDEACRSVQRNAKCCQTPCGLKCLQPNYDKKGKQGAHSDQYNNNSRKVGRPEYESHKNHTEIARSNEQVTKNRPMPVRNNTEEKYGKEKSTDSVRAKRDLHGQVSGHKEGEKNGQKPSKGRGIRDISENLPAKGYEDKGQGIIQGQAVKKREEPGDKQEEEVGKQEPTKNRIKKDINRYTLGNGQISAKFGEFKGAKQQQKFKKWKNPNIKEMEAQEPRKENERTNIQGSRDIKKRERVGNKGNAQGERKKGKENMEGEKKTQHIPAESWEQEKHGQIWPGGRKEQAEKNIKYLTQKDKPKKEASQALKQQKGQELNLQREEADNKKKVFHKTNGQGLDQEQRQGSNKLKNQPKEDKRKIPNEGLEKENKGQYGGERKELGEAKKKGPNKENLHMGPYRKRGNDTAEKSKLVLNDTKKQVTTEEHRQEFNEKNGHALGENRQVSNETVGHELEKEIRHVADREKGHELTPEKKKTIGTEKKIATEKENSQDSNKKKGKKICRKYGKRNGKGSEHVNEQQKGQTKEQKLGKVHEQPLTQKHVQKPEYTQVDHPEHSNGEKAEHTQSKQPEHTQGEQPKRTKREQPEHIQREQSEDTKGEQLEPNQREQPEHTQEEQSENIQGEYKKRTLAEQPDYIPEENSSNTYEENPADTYEENPADTYEENPEDTYEENREDTYEENPEDTYEENPEDTYEENREDTYEENPEDNYEENPEDTYEEKLVEEPEQTKQSNQKKKFKAI